MKDNSSVFFSSNNIYFAQKEPIKGKIFETSKCSLKNFMAPFYGWGSTASRLEPLRGGSLLFTTKFPEVPGTHFIDLGRMKGRPWSHPAVLNTGPLDWESSQTMSNSSCQFSNDKSIPLQILYHPSVS